MTKPTDTTDGDDAQASTSEPRSRSSEESAGGDRSRRDDRTKQILDDADKRDETAAARDAVADERSRLADREAFASPDGAYPGHGERRAAALDRADSKTDRESSAKDRANLTDDADDTGAPVLAPSSDDR